MGETISTLVFRPPTCTFIRPNRFFFLDVTDFATTETEIATSITSCSTGRSCGAIPTANKDNPKNTGPHRIPAFFIKRRGAKITFLFSHGNAEDLGMMYNRMKEMARVLGVNVMAYDYTGYGMSSGEPSEEMCYRNIEVAYKYLREDRNIAASHIVLYGRSLGSGPSVHLARKTAMANESVAGLILHSPFLSIYRIVMDCGFNLVGDMFKNSTNAKDVICPVLIIHGTKDEVVPFWHGDQLLQTFPPNCRARPYWVEDLGHNNIEVYAKKDYVCRVTNFLNQYVSASTESITTQPIKPFKPMSVPETQRYIPEGSKNSSLFVNKSWMKHGKDIIDEVKCTNSGQEKVNHMNENATKITADDTKNHEASCSSRESAEIELSSIEVDFATKVSAATRLFSTRDRIIGDTDVDSDEEDSMAVINTPTKTDKHLHEERQKSTRRRPEIAR